MRATRTLAILAVIPLLALATGCGNGGGGGSASSDPLAPTIFNLRAAFGGPCIFSTGNVSGTLELVSVDYTDADGNVSGGVIESTGSFPGGGSIPVRSAIPSRFVSITGTTSGTVSILFCVRFGGNPSITERVQIADASGRTSNVLTLQVANPGLPQTRRDGDLAPGRIPWPGP